VLNVKCKWILMQGIVASGLVIVVIAWCIKMRGPIFASAFNPLQLLLVAISAYLLLDEKLYLGRYMIKSFSYLKHILFIMLSFFNLWYAWKLIWYNLVVYSVFGAVLIVCGIYAVLWSKNKEMKKKNKSSSLEINMENKAGEFVIPSPDKWKRNDIQNLYHFTLIYTYMKVREINIRYGEFVVSKIHFSRWSDNYFDYVYTIF